MFLLVLWIFFWTVECFVAQCFIYIDGLSDVFFTFLQELAIFDSFFNSGFVDFHLFGVEFIKSSRILAFKGVVLGFDPVPVLRWVSQYLLDLIYVVPTSMEETPKVALDIHCLQRGGGAALTQMINLIPPLRGDGSARASMA